VALALLSVESVLLLVVLVSMLVQSALMSVAVA
jgi:hypothetical protein